MTKQHQTLDELLAEEESILARRQRERAEAAKAMAGTPEGIAEEERQAAARAQREAKRQAEIDREIRQGLRDANGDWIDQPESNDEDADDDEEYEEDDHL